MLITALLSQPWQSDWQPSKVATALRYKPMTLSRAVKELTVAELTTLYQVGRSHWLRMELLPDPISERAKPVLRTLGERTVWVAAHGILAHLPGIRCKLHNLAQLQKTDAKKFAEQAETLAARFGQGISQLKSA